MREFEVVVSDIAKERLHNCLDYIKYILGNDEAARSVYYDYVATRQNLEHVAGSIWIRRLQE